MKKLSLLILISVFFFSCGKKEKSAEDTSKQNSEEGYVTEGTDAEAVSTYDPHRGEGKFDKVELGASLDQAMATQGEKVYVASSK